MTDVTAPEQGQPVPSAPAPAYKLYSPGQVGLASFLGTPLAGGFLAFQDWRRLGEPAKARHALLLAVGATGVGIALAFVLPDSVSRPLPGIVAVSYWMAIKAELAARFEAHVKARGGKESGWKAAGVGLLGMAAVLAVLVPVFLAAGPTDPHVSFGADQTVFFEKGATEADARALGQALQALGFFDGKSGKDVYLEGEGAGVSVGFILPKEGAWDEPGMIQGFEQLRGELQQDAFAGRHVSIRLCNEWIMTKRTLK